MMIRKPEKPKNRGLRVEAEGGSRRPRIRLRLEDLEFLLSGLFMPRKMAEGHIVLLVRVCVCVFQNRVLAIT